MKATTSIRFLCTVVLMHTNTLTSSLDINELHSEMFPNRNINHGSKRQYVYGRVLPLSDTRRIPESNSNSKPFEMNNMFASAMGSKLKRIVSHIDGKVKNGDSNPGDSKRSNVVNGDTEHQKMENQYKSDEEGVRNGVFFGGREVDPTQGEIGAEPMWLSEGGPLKMEPRVPPGFRRKNSEETNNADPSFYNDNQGAWNEFPGDKTKKDDEEVEDFDFFEDEDKVMKGLKRVFVEEGDKKEDSSEDKDLDDEEGDKERRHKELVDEYIRHMAQSMSINKRSSMPWKDSEQAREFSEAQKMDGRLKKIEDLILGEANDIMENGNENPDAAESMVMNRVNVARDLELIRKSLIDLEKVMYDIRQEENMSPDEMFSLRKRGNNLASALGVMAPASKKRQVQQLQQNDECPDEEYYNRDCSLLTNFLPKGDYKNYFKTACNNHRMCYVCMDIFGLSETECDTGFLRQASSICENNRPCRTATKTMVLNNRRERSEASLPTNDCAMKLCLKNGNGRRRR